MRICLNVFTPRNIFLLMGNIFFVENLSEFFTMGKYFFIVDLSQKKFKQIHVKNFFHPPKNYFFSHFFFSPLTNLAG